MINSSYYKENSILDILVVLLRIQSPKNLSSETQPISSHSKKCRIAFVEPCKNEFFIIIQIDHLLL